MDFLILKIRASGLFFCAFFNFLLAFFVWSKDIKNKLYLHLGFTALFSALYSLACACVYFFWHESSPTFFNTMCARATYLGVLILPSYVCFTYYFVGNVRNLKYKILLLYVGASFIGTAALITPNFLEYPYLDYPHIVGIPGKWDILGRGYIFICLVIGLYLLTREYFRSAGMRKNKIKYFFIGMAMYSGAGIVFASVLPYFMKVAAYYDLAAYFSLCFMLLTTYAIIRYRFLEIETVIHKTLLWLSSISLIIVPVSIIAHLIIAKAMNFLPAFLNVVVLGSMFLLFYYYYAHLRPQVDHIFRRRRYDYLKVLGQIAQQTSGIIDIDELSRKTLTGIKTTIYPQTLHLFLKDEEKNRYYLKASIVNEKYLSANKETTSWFIPGDSEMVSVLKETVHPIEKELLNVDPVYKDVKEEVKEFFKRTDTTLFFGLFMRDELVGLLLVGKKESLQEYSRLDINALNNLALSIASSFYTSLHHHDILEGQRLLQEVTLARHIQENLLPQKPPVVPGLLLYGLYVPSRELGGDYYDYIIRDISLRDAGESQIFIAIGDVSGKGLDAGLVVSSVKSSLLSLMRYNESPRDILNILNQDLCKCLNQQKFISLLLLRYMSPQNKLIYSSAGHEHILIYRASTSSPQQSKSLDPSSRTATIEIIKSGGVILGMISNIETFLEEKSIILGKGDKVLLYTDGVTEARNPEEKLYGLPRLSECFRKNAHLPIREIIYNINGDIKEFISTREQYDDITLVGIEKN